MHDCVFSDEKNTTTWLHPDTGQPAMTGFCRPLGKGLLKESFVDSTHCVQGSH